MKAAWPRLTRPVYPVRMLSPVALTTLMRDQAGEVEPVVAGDEGEQRRARRRRRAPSARCTAVSNSACVGARSSPSRRRCASPTASRSRAVPNSPYGRTIRISDQQAECGEELVLAAERRCPARPRRGRRTRRRPARRATLVEPADDHDHQHRQPEHAHGRGDAADRADQDAGDAAVAMPAASRQREDAGTLMPHASRRRPGRTPWRAGRRRRARSGRPARAAAISRPPP